MTFDIIDFTEAELVALSTVQMRLLRTAQKNKNELEEQLSRDKQTFFNILVADGMLNSNLYEAKCEELDGEYERQLAILKDDLVYNMSLNVPTADDDEAGGSGSGSGSGSGGDPAVGYIVDYSLSYLDRYQIVRNYYMSISDPAERLAVYAADTIAVSYLGQYYNTLYNVLAQYV